MAEYSFDIASLLAEYGVNPSDISPEIWSEAESIANDIASQYGTSIDISSTNIVITYDASAATAGGAPAAGGASTPSLLDDFYANNEWAGWSSWGLSQLGNAFTYDPRIDPAVDGLENLLSYAFPESYPDSIDDYMLLTPNDPDSAWFYNPSIDNPGDWVDWYEKDWSNWDVMVNPTGDQDWTAPSQEQTPPLDSAPTDGFQMPLTTSEAWEYTGSDDFSVA